MIPTLKRLLHHPLVNLVVGVAMVVAGAGEVVESLRELEEFSLQADHGVMLMGVVTFLKGFVEGVEGLEKVERQSE